MPDGDAAESYQTAMDGWGITLWRIVLMPVPVAIDLATFPLQLIALMFLRH